MRFYGSQDWLALTRLPATRGQDYLSAALDSIEIFDNSSSLKLNGKKTEGSSVGSVVGNKRNAPPKRILNGAKIELNSLVHDWISVVKFLNSPFFPPYT